MVFTFLSKVNFSPFILKNGVLKRQSFTSFPQKLYFVIVVQTLQLLKIELHTNEFINCPPGKDISRHFVDQLTQLNIKPRSPEDSHQLMQILNSYLGYPDEQLANFHCKANRLGLLDLTMQQRMKIIQRQSLEEQYRTNIRQSIVLRANSQTCHCCGFILQKHAIPTCGSDLKNINNLGTANLVFFRTFMTIGILLLVMTVAYSAFAFGSSIYISKTVLPDYCNNQSNYLICISLGVKNHKYINNQQYPNFEGQRSFKISCILGLLMIIVWWLLFIFQKRQIGKIQNDRIWCISDYTVLIENMPIGLSEEQVDEQFKNYLRMLKAEDQSIHLNDIKVVIYNEAKPFYLNENQFKDQELGEILKAYKEVRDKIVGYVEECMQNTYFVTSADERNYSYGQFHELSQMKNRKCEQIAQEIKAKLNSRQQVSKTVVFVTFLTHEMQQFVLSHNRNSIFQRLNRLLFFWTRGNYFSVVQANQKIQDLKIQQPPQPEDINWGNLGFSFRQKLWRKCSTVFATLLMMGIGFVIVYALSHWGSSKQNSWLISNLISLVIALTNLCIIKVIQFMTIFQKDYSMNNYQMSIAIKSVIAQVANLIVVPFLLNYYIEKEEFLFGETGLIKDIFVLAIFSSFIPPLVRFFDPYHFFLRIRYKYYRKGVKRLHLSQFELNEMNEKMQFQIGLQYIYLISNYLFICFYVPLQPIICLFAIIGLFFMYWIQKYSLLSRSQRPVPGPDVITSTMYQLIYFGPISFALGSLTWSLFYDQFGLGGSKIINIVSLALAFIIFIFPYDRCLPQAFEKEKKNYYQRRIYFPSEYDRLNPSTSRKAIEQYRNFLSEKRKELKLAQNARFSQQVFQELAISQPKNIYKSIILNKFTRNKQEQVIQQIFNNQSRNVVNPRLLLNALERPNENEEQKHRRNNQQARKRQLNKKDDPHIEAKIIPEQGSNKHIVDLENSRVVPKKQECFLSLYHSNIRIDDILLSQLSQRNEKNPQNPKKRIQ